MDNGFSKGVVQIPITRRLLFSKPYQSHYPLLSASTINSVGRKDSFAVSNKNHVRFGPKLRDIVKHKLSYGAKILPFGREGKFFRRSFSISNSEKLLLASQCCIYTTAGAIKGTMFISTKQVRFCSDRSLKMHSLTGELLKFEYKVSIPLGKIKGVAESMNMKKTSLNKFMEFVTVDDFNFWFMGFPNYKKTLRYLHQKLSLNRLSN